MYLGLALGVVTLHALALVTIPLAATSDVLLDLCALVGCLACCARGRVCVGTARRKWLLVAAGLFIWCVGQSLLTYNEAWLHLHQAPTAINSDFYFFLFGIPLLLTISSANENRSGRTFVCIDGLQAALAVYLVHLQLFPGVTGSPAQDAISSLRMTYAYDAENLILASTVSLRLFAKPQGEDKRLYRSLAVFLYSYAVLAAVLNYIAITTQIPSGSWLDLLWDAPFLLFTFLVCRLPNDSHPTECLPIDTRAGLLITSASPVFFTMALLIMSVCVARARFVPGIAAIIFALLSYGLRNAILQSEYMRSERKLVESEVVIRKANEQLERLSLLDGLTGIPNRRRFEQVLATEWDRAEFLGTSLSLLVIDVDYFKLLNDTHGHLYGDDCLIETAGTLSNCLRSQSGMIARYGGEEFTAVLPGVDEAGAIALAEQMRLAVETMSIPNNNAPDRRLTVSIGVAVKAEPLAQHSRDLFSRADQALYSAKSGGRNRVHLFRLDEAGEREHARGPHAYGQEHARA